jgi:hypothetical protein
MIKIVLIPAVFDLKRMDTVFVSVTLLYLNVLILDSIVCVYEMVTI